MFATTAMALLSELSRPYEKPQMKNKTVTSVQYFQESRTDVRIKLFGLRMLTKPK